MPNTFPGILPIVLLMQMEHHKCAVRGARFSGVGVYVYFLATSPYLHAMNVILWQEWHAPTL